MNNPQQRLKECMQYMVALLAIIFCTALTACAAESAKPLSASEMAPVASSASAPCAGCAATKEEQAHPNKAETVAEEGDIQQWNEGCKCYQYYHYRDEARQVCCYWANRGPSGYAWMGIDGQERYLSKEQAEKPVPTCKDTMTLAPKQHKAKH